MLYIKQRVRVHSYGHTDRRTDAGRDIVTRKPVVDLGEKFKGPGPSFWQHSFFSQVILINFQ
mgnify:CR=1 FL=1